MFYFGIDWSQDHHNLCICNESGARVSELGFPQSVTGFQRLEAERQKLGVLTTDCVVGIETSHHLLVDFLLDQQYAVYLIPPQATQAYRHRYSVSGAHTDETDAALLAQVVRTEREHHRRLNPLPTLTQQMLVQVRLIETLRRSIQRQTNQLRAMLLRVYPQAIGLFKDLASPISLQFLNHYPSIAEAQALTLEDFKAFCQSQHYTRTDYMCKHHAQLLTPAPQPSAALATAYRRAIQQLAQVLLPQVQARQQALTELGRLFAQHADAAIFESLPGAAELLAPALLVKFGDDRGRFPHPSDVQTLAGTCPVTNRSGKKQSIVFRRGCDKEFRRIAQQFARTSLLKSSWAQAYYQEIRPRCASDSHAYRCLANRWLAIIWKLWQAHQPYDETAHLRRRAARRKPRGSSY